MKSGRTLNILYCIDDEDKKNYSKYLGVSILSLLKNNENENINIYIISTKFAEEDRKYIENLVRSYKQNIYFSHNIEIIPKEIKNKLPMPENGHISTYYRLFFNNCFPEIKDRLLYLDCDTIINKNLSKFYNMSFEDKTIIGCPDFPFTRYELHKIIGTGINNYINAGVILINIPKYIDINLIKEINYVNKNYNIKYYDQDYLNIIFKGKIGLYPKLQKIIVSKFDWNVDDYLIIHMIEKPKKGLYFGPITVRKKYLFYLQQTKWKNLDHREKMSLSLYINYLYYYLIKKYIVIIVGMLFGRNKALFVDNLMYNLGVKAHLLKKFIMNNLFIYKKGI